MPASRTAASAFSATASCPPAIRLPSSPPAPIPRCTISASREGGPAQRRKLDFINTLDRGFVQASGADAHVEAAIRNYEIAWRMQSAVPELCDISGESAATRDLYGVDDVEPKKAAYARSAWSPAASWSKASASSS